MALLGGPASPEWLLQSILGIGSIGMCRGYHWCAADVGSGHRGWNELAITVCLPVLPSEKAGSSCCAP